MKKLIFIFLSVLFVNAGMAQTRVTGTVTASEDGSPIPYAVVLVKGLRGVGTNTDADGKYSLSNVPADAVLVFSYVGYKTQEIPVSGRSVIVHLPLFGFSMQRNRRRRNGWQPPLPSIPVKPAIR